MIHCYWLAHQQQCKSEEKERETLSDIWVSHHRQCSHFLWGWRCWLQEPAVSGQRLTPAMVNLRMTGLCHSPRPIRSVTNCPSTTSDGRCGSDWTSAGWVRWPTAQTELAAFPTQHRRGGALMLGMVIFSVNFFRFFIHFIHNWLIRMPSNLLNFDSSKWFLSFLRLRFLLEWYTLKPCKKLLWLSYSWTIFFKSLIWKNCSI